MQLGFVIDQTRCIGCHACTVACKSENHVPVGSFRTWVKYTETGEFPDVDRSFAVLRCNQCTSAPCVTICPTNALSKRADGIVDVDHRSCIGCKSCMHGCPYDALYLNPDKGTAEKCHFCAHRTERGLAPACAVVCPTEAIVPGDFDDPGSRVSQMKRELELSARKVQAGTGPNVLYRDVAPAGIDPLVTTSAKGHLWADRHPGLQIDEGERAAFEARARTTYDVAHPLLWGWKITAYLFTKSLAAGVFLAAGVAGAAPFRTESASGWGDAGALLLAMFWLVVTSVLLVADLKRPERFYYILVRPNWSSWLVRGTWALISYGTVLFVWAALVVAGVDLAPGVEVGLTLVGGFAAALSACYTAWLFGQAKGRVLWMRRGLWAHLIVQAMVAGSAALLLLAPLVDFPDLVRVRIGGNLAVWLGLHAAFVLVEAHLAPKKRQREYDRAHGIAMSGSFARRHWRFGIGVGIFAPLLLLALPPSFPAFGIVAAVCALIGLWVEEDNLVRAGQAQPIS